MLLMLSLFTNLFFLNFSNKLIICAAFFLGSALTINTIVNLYDERKAINVLIFCTLLNCILKWKDLGPLMLLISYSAILISLSLNIIIFNKLKSKFGFHIANFFTLTLGSVLDSAVVCVGLLHKFTLHKCLNIFARDLIFKCSYTSIVTVMLFIGLYLFSRLNYSAKSKKVN